MTMLDTYGARHYTVYNGEFYIIVNTYERCGFYYLDTAGHLRFHTKSTRAVPLILPPSPLPFVSNLASRIYTMREINDKLRRIKTIYDTDRMHVTKHNCRFALFVCEGVTYCLLTYSDIEEIRICKNGLVIDEVVVILPEIKLYRYFPTFLVVNLDTVKAEDLVDATYFFISKIFEP